MQSVIWTHQHRIICPECLRVNDAQVEKREGEPWPSYLHTCTLCGYNILESEWQPIVSADALKVVERENATLRKQVEILTVASSHWVRKTIEAEQENVTLGQQVAALTAQLVTARAIMWQALPFVGNAPFNGAITVEQTMVAWLEMTDARQQAGEG